MCLERKKIFRGWGVQKKSLLAIFGLAFQFLGPKFVGPIFHANYQFYRKTFVHKKFQWWERNNFCILCFWLGPPCWAPGVPKWPGRSSRRQILRQKGPPDTQNIDFLGKFQIETPIIFWFYMGLPFNFLPKNGPLTLKSPFFCQNGSRPQPKMQLSGSNFGQKYQFYRKISNGNVFQLIESNNFCIDTFVIGPIA